MHNKRKILTWLIAFLVIAFVGVTSAENETHLANGSWISQSDSEQEHILTFYPDGTFHLVITESEYIDYLDEEEEDYLDEEEEDYEDEEEEDYEGDEDYEDYEDGEDYEGWEEFIADFDVNDNGVFDEEDFEAAQERGDEDLTLSWDDVLQEVGDANGDGVIDQGEYERAFEEDSGDWEEWLAEDRIMEAKLAELMTDAFGETMVTTTSIKGTWEASDDHVTLTRLEEVYEFNSLTLEEFYALILDIEFDVMVLVSEMNDEEAMSEEEFFLSILSDSWPDSEGNPVDVEEPESLEELKALVVNQFVSMIRLFADKPAEFGMEEETFVFFLDRDEMTLTHSDRETLVFPRVDASSAIEPFSWGQIKALHR